MYTPSFTSAIIWSSVGEPTGPGSTCTQDCLVGRQFQVALDFAFSIDHVIPRQRSDGRRHAANEDLPSGVMIGGKPAVHGQTVAGHAGTESCRLSGLSSPRHFW